MQPPPSCAEVDAVLMPDRDTVRLSKSVFTGQWQLAHLLTFEVAQLPVGEWMLTFDSEGMAEVISDAGDLFFVEELLTMSVYKKPDGTLMLCTRDREGAESWEPLLDVKSKYRCAKLHARVGASLALLDISARVFCAVMPNRCYFLFRDLHKALRMSNNNNQVFKWVGKSAERWNIHLKAIGLDGHLTVGSVLGDGEQNEKVLFDKAALSTTALLTIGMCWCSCPPRHFGLRDDTAISACKELLQSLVLWFLKRHGGFQLEFFVDEDVTKTWPDLPKGRCPLALRVNEVGVVDLMPWVQLVPPTVDDGRLSASWLEGLGLQGATTCPLLDLLSKACVMHHTGPNKSFWVQLAHTVGQALDSAFLKTLKDRKDGETFLEYCEGLEGLEDERLSSFLVAYTDKANECLRQCPLFLSLATDKSSVKSFNLQTTVAALPNNVVVWLVPQVHHHFDSELALASEAGKREEVEAALEGSRDRQRNWLKRSAPDGRASWRTNKRYRVSTYRWLQAVDKQLVTVFGTGLQRYCQPEEMEKREAWNKWPVITVVVDYGADGVAACNAAIRKLNCNLDLLPDESHLCWRGIQQALRNSKLWGFVLTAMVAGNTAHGPWAEDLRHRQACAAMEQLFQRESPRKCPLFLNLCDEIASDLGNRLEYKVDDLAQAVWSYLAESKPWQNKGDKSNLNRFLSAVLQGAHQQHFFSTRAFIYTFVCLELDQMSSKGFVETLAKVKDPDSGATKHTDQAEKALRAAAQNQMVVAAIFYSDLQNKRLLRMVVRSCKPLMTWYTDQQKVLRSVNESSDWMLQQMTEGVKQNTYNMLGQLTDEEAMRSIGFFLPRLNYSATVDDETMALDEELAVSMGRLILELVGTRLRRMLWLLIGWPHQARRFLDDQLAQEAIDGFKQVYDHFQEFKKKAGDERNSPAANVVRRSFFNHVAVQQLWEMLKAKRFQLDAECKEFLTQRFNRLMATQACEDGFNRQKNFKVQGYASHYGRPERSMAIPIMQKTLSDVHNFAEPDPATLTIYAGRTLGKHAFECKGEPKGWKRTDIITTKASPEWYSPGSDNLPVQFADISLMKETVDSGRWHLLGNTWLGCVVDPAHTMLLRKVGSGDNGWMFCLTHFAESSCMFWPAVVKEWKNRPMDFYAVPSTSCSGPVLRPLLDLREWEAWSFRWRSPSWHWTKLDSLNRPPMESGVRALLEDGPQQLLTVLAQNGFFCLGVTVLRSFAKYLGATVQPSATAFEVLMALLGEALPQSTEEQRLDIAERRLGKMYEAEGGCAEELLELDEKWDMLEKEDKKEIEQEAKKHETSKAASRDFAQSLRAERQRLAAKKSSSSSTNSGKGNVRTSTSEYTGPRSLPVGHISHETGKKLAPPGSHVWRGLKVGSWNGQFGTLPRTSASWCKYTERGALIRVLRKLWDDWCTHWGESRAAVPIAGLWDDAGPSALTGAACSSASA